MLTTETILKAFAERHNVPHDQILLDDAREDDEPWYNVAIVSSHGCVIVGYHADTRVTPFRFTPDTPWKGEYADLVLEV